MATETQDSGFHEKYEVIVVGGGDPKPPPRPEESMPWVNSTAARSGADEGSGDHAGCPYSCGRQHAGDGCDMPNAIEMSRSLPL